MSLRATLIAVALLAAAGCGRTPPRLTPPAEEYASPIGPDSFHVEFRTTRGAFLAVFHRAWSPLGVDRVHDLVRRGAYDDIRIFRVVQNFVAQFGLGNDSAATRGWQSRGLDDEPVVVSNTAGRISFARGGPRTRSLQLFINLRDNPRLDTIPAGGIVGYPPLGEVIRGWDAVALLNAEYGNAPSGAQDSIARLGNAWLDDRYPRLDRILSARVVKSWRSSGER